MKERIRSVLQKNVETKLQSSFRNKIKSFRNEKNFVKKFTKSNYQLAPTRSCDDFSLLHSIVSRVGETVIQLPSRSLDWPLLSPRPLFSPRSSHRSGPPSPSPNLAGHCSYLMFLESWQLFPSRNYSRLWNRTCSKNSYSFKMYLIRRLEKC